MWTRTLLSKCSIISESFITRYDLHRPSLAAQLLHCDGVLTGYLAQDAELEQLYRKQLQVIAKQGDIFIAFSPFGNENPILNAIHCANNENLMILAFTSNRNDHTRGLLSEDDLEISMPSNNEMRVIEGHHFCVNLLCELVDNLLFHPTT